VVGWSSVSKKRNTRIISLGLAQASLAGAGPVRPVPSSAALLDKPST
jgi:hypothetical protein